MTLLPGVLLVESGGVDELRKVEIASTGPLHARPKIKHHHPSSQRGWCVGRVDTRMITRVVVGCRNGGLHIYISDSISGYRL
jgi:hypothetical protein